MQKRQEQKDKKNIYCKLLVVVTIVARIKKCLVR